MSDDKELTSGGEEGESTRNPSRLRPSELRLLRRMSDRFPFTQEDRIRAVSSVNEAITGGKNHRTRLAGVRAMGEMERINLAEVGMIVEKPAAAAGLVANTINVTNNVAAVVQEAANDPAYLEWLESRRVDGDRNAGAVRWNRDKRSMADGSASQSSEPTPDAGS